MTRRPTPTPRFSPSSPMQTTSRPETVSCDPERTHAKISGAALRHITTRYALFTVVNTAPFSNAVGKPATALRTGQFQLQSHHAQLRAHYHGTSTSIQTAWSIMPICNSHPQLVVVRCGDKRCHPLRFSLVNKLTATVRKRSGGDAQ